MAMGIRYQLPAKVFGAIPGSPIVYWLPEKLINSFKEDNIGMHAISDGQTKTGNNDKYLRLLWEVDNHNIGKYEKWVLHAKGGQFRRWYGNIDTVIDWSETARKHYREDHVARIAPEYIWFREGICWTMITSNERFAVRILTADSTFNLAAPSIFFTSHEETMYVLALLNSVVAERIIRALNPTLNTNIGDIMAQPYIYPNNRLSDEAIQLADECVAITQEEWDSYETSLDFDKHPLI